MGALVGFVAGLGLLLLLRAVLEPKTSLVERLTAVQSADPVGFAEAQRVAGQSWFERARAFGQAEVFQRFLVPLTLRSDLAVLGITPAQHAWTKVTLYVAALLLAPTAGLVMARMSLPVGLISAVSIIVVCAMIGAVTDKYLAGRAQALRDDFRSSLAAYLDLVAMLVAGRSHINTALRTAAMVGDGPGWSSIRRHQNNARMNGHGEARGISTLGAEWDMPSVVEFGHQVETIDASGAQAADSLRSRANALRSQENADALGTAKSKTAMLSFPNLLVAGAFFLMVLYPSAMSFFSP